MNYRTEIDGLRALAVLPVILFHAGFEIFSGGFVGVDIFFVISGYLITTIILSERDAGRFSILRFYERRARRILPALFLVMVVCVPFAWVWMLPDAFQDFARSMIFAALFISNVHFWENVGYFAIDAELRPLLHTWSLAVEEQYYLFFPFLLGLLGAFSRFRYIIVIGLLAVLSLALSEWGWRNFPEQNFFFTFSRMWELFVGSICAFIVFKKPIAANGPASFIGVAMILYAIFVYDASVPFPSVYTLVPVMGTALLLLFAQQGTLVANLLSMRWPVAIGLVSYSAYLWHQPLFAFARLRSVTEPDALIMISLAIASLVLAGLSWRFVEQPFRKRPVPAIPRQSAVFALSVLGIAAFVTFGWIGYAQNGFDWRLPDRIRQIAAASKDHADLICNFDSTQPLPVHPQTQCLTQAPADSQTVMLLGDSHSNAIGQMLAGALVQEQLGVYRVSYSGCVPFPGMRHFESSDNHQCSRFVEDALAYAETAKVDTLVLTARFPFYLRGDRYDNGEGGVEIGSPAVLDIDSAEGSTWDSPERRRRVLKHFEASIAELALKFNVVLVSPIPEAGWIVPQTYAKYALFDRPLTTSFEHYKDRTKEVLGLFDKLGQNFERVKVARVYNALCSDATGRCLNADRQGVYYFDDDHLSTAGAGLVIPLIVREILQIQDDMPG